MNGLALPRRLRIGPPPPVRVQLKQRGLLDGFPSRPLYYGRPFPFTLHRPRRRALLVRWEDIGDFLIEHRGRSITARPTPGVPFGTFRDLLLTVITSFALLERGVETLHASSVAWKGRALALLGGPGSGKSTLAAFFARRGGRLLADDLLAVARPRRRALAYPGVPEIKLVPAAARALGLVPRRLPRVEPGQSKRIWRAPAASGPWPLAALYFPRVVASPRSGVRLVPLTRQAAFRSLLSCSYNVARPTRRRLRRQFSLFARLARSAPARRLLIPGGWNRLEEVGERIERDLAGLKS